MYRSYPSAPATNRMQLCVQLVDRCHVPPQSWLHFSAGHAIRVQHCVWLLTSCLSMLEGNNSLCKVLWERQGLKTSELDPELQVCPQDTDHLNGGKKGVGSRSHLRSSRSWELLAHPRLHSYTASRQPGECKGKAITAGEGAAWEQELPAAPEGQRGWKCSSPIQAGGAGSQDSWVVLEQRGSDATARGSMEGAEITTPGSCLWLLHSLSLSPIWGKQ